MFMNKILYKENLYKCLKENGSEILLQQSDKAKVRVVRRFECPMKKNVGKQC